jgi:hypothetical protein
MIFYYGDNYAKHLHNFIWYRALVNYVNNEEKIMIPANKKWDIPTKVIGFRVPVNSEDMLKKHIQKMIDGYVAKDGVVNNIPDPVNNNKESIPIKEVANFVVRLAGMGDWDSALEFINHQLEEWAT